MARRRAARQLYKKKDSDSDSIDLESTEASEVDEGKDYAVECILAEDEDVEGKMFYLLKWEDYPLLRSTWEPAGNIKDQSTFDEWEAQKERIEKGLAKPFDVVKFREELEQEEEAKELRRKRRERKRKSLGFTNSSPVSKKEVCHPPAKEIDSDSSSEAREINEDLEDVPSIPLRAQRPTQKPTVSRATVGEDIDVEDTLLRGINSTKSRPRRRHNIPDEDIDVNDDSLDEELGKQLKEQKAFRKVKPIVRKIPERELNSASNESESTSSRNVSPQRPPKNTTKQRNRLGAEAPSRTGYLGTANRGINVSKTPSRGRGAAATRGSHGGRGGWRTAGSALNFTTGNTHTTGTLQYPRGLATAILNAAKANSNKPKQHFTTPSMLRKAELASRGLADRVPDIAFVGPLIKPSEYNISRPRKKSISSKVDAQRKNSDSMQDPQEGQPSWAGNDAETEPLQPSADNEVAATPVAEDTQMRELPSWTPRGPRAMINDQFQNKAAASIPASTNSGNLDIFGTIPSNSIRTSSTAPQQTFQLLKPVMKVKFSEYRSRRVLESFGDAISIQAVFGDREVSPILVAFNGTNKNDQDSWIHALSELEMVSFNLACVAQDFQAQIPYLHNHVLASGDIATERNGSQIIQVVAEHLRPLSGLVFSHKLFSILVYPAKCEEWKFIDTNTNNDGDSPLLYRIFRGLADVTGEVLGDAVEHTVSMINLNRNYLESLLNLTQSLQYGRLIPNQTEANKSHNFYLLFPISARSSADLFANWLRVCDPECRIYTNLQVGSWDFFTDNPNFNVGTVIIHQSLLPSISKVPRLAEMMDIKRQFSFWCFGDSPSPNLVNRSLGYPMVRLFPQGGAVFLTPSFLKSQPKRTYELLTWFQEKIIRATPGTWKLVVSHNCCDYLLDLALERASAGEMPHENCLAEQKNAASNHSRYRKGKFEFLNYQILDKLMRQELMAGHPFNWNRSTPDEVECPIVYADESLNPDDEKGLTTWFAVWSMLHLHLFRKFIVVGTALSKTRFRTPPIEKASLGIKSREQMSENFKASTTKTNNNQPQAIETQRSTNKSNALELPAKGWKRNSFAEVNESCISSPPDTHANSKTTTHLASSTNLSKQLNTNIDESILYFIVITGADKATASHWVEKFNNDAITAAKHYAREQQEMMEVDGAENDADVSAILNFAGPYASGPDAPVIPSIANNDLMRAMELYHIGHDRSCSPTNRFPSYDGPDDLDAGPRYQPPSKSGIVTDEDGKRRFVPRSVRPSGTTRPEINVRPGYVPPEDKEAYRNRRSIRGISLYGHEDMSNQGSGSTRNYSVQSPTEGTAEARQPSVVKRATTALETEERMTSAEESGGRSHSVLEVEMTIPELVEPQTPAVDRKFDIGETTMEWYGRMSKEGKGWEHIYVKDWEACFKALGIQAKSK